MLCDEQNQVSHFVSISPDLGHWVFGASFGDFINYESIIRKETHTRVYPPDGPQGSRVMGKASLE